MHTPLSFPGCVRLKYKQFAAGAQSPLSVRNAEKTPSHAFGTGRGPKYDRLPLWNYISTWIWIS